MLLVRYGNMLRAAGICAQRYTTHSTFMTAMDLGRAPCRDMVSMASTPVPLVGADSMTIASSLVTASPSSSFAATSTSSPLVAESSSSLSSLVVALTPSSSQLSQSSPPYTSSHEMHAIATSQTFMPNKCLNSSHIRKNTASLHHVTALGWILSGQQCNRDCSPMAMQKVTILVHHFNCMSIQRQCSTLTDSFMQVHNCGGAEGKQELVSKGLDTSRDMSTKSKEFVVVVESPTKARAIQRYLGTDFMVLPCHGHVRDLAARAGSIRPNDDYAMVWEVLEAAQPYVTRIKNAIKGAKCLVLATDPDDEGEAIAWHIAEVMKAEGLLRNKKVKVVRVAFNEVTKKAVLSAMQDPRKIILTLVNVYLARRALDYLVGFALSPLLWRTLPGSQCAGCVKSTALKLVCDREIAVEEFMAQEYWTVELSASCEGLTEENHLFPLRPICLDGKKLEQFSLLCDSAKLLTEKLESASIKVSAIMKGSKRRNPPEPYTFSTLLQDAQARLGFGTMQTMNLAQKLYEGVNLGKGEFTGLITYMRTDVHQLSKEAVREIRAYIIQRYGDAFLPPSVRKFSSKDAQGSQEAIRPTNMWRIPSTLCDMLEKDALALYTLIWRRTVESQMEQAVYEEVAVDFMTEDGAICLQATGSHVSFLGFLAATKDTYASSDLEVAFVSKLSEHQDLTSESWGKVSALKEGDVVQIRKSEARQHFTCPPTRYTEGLLVKAMEEHGIGRPSIYATTLQTLQAKNYVKVEDHQIIPEVRGHMATTFLSHYFPKFIDHNCIALLEKQLNEVSRGHLSWKQVLRDFWPDFHANVSSVMKMPPNKVIDVLHDLFFTRCFMSLGMKGRSCPRCGIGKLTLKVGCHTSGLFLMCNSYRVCRFKVRAIGIEGGDSLSVEDSSNLDLKKENIDVLLGLDPASKSEVRVKKGPYGFYVQLGTEERGMQFFRVPRDVELTAITLEKAIQLTKYPLNLGNHPEDGRAVILGLNDSSYFVRHRSTTAVVPKRERTEDMTLERALKLLKGHNVTRSGRKSLAVNAAMKEEKKLKDEKRKARKGQSLNTPVVPAVSKSRKVAADGKAKTTTKQSRAKLAVGSKSRKVVADGNAKTTTRQSRAKLVAGNMEADNGVGVGAAVGDGEVQDKDTDFVDEVKSARM